MCVKELWGEHSLPGYVGPGKSWEPPGADSHAGWCGGWGLLTPGYPIKLFHIPYSIFHDLYF
jgi:hypothetical protein